jgi:hypothetical protein
VKAFSRASSRFDALDVNADETKRSRSLQSDRPSVSDGFENQERGENG